MKRLRRKWWRCWWWGWSLGWELSTQSYMKCENMIINNWKHYTMPSSSNDNVQWTQRLSLKQSLSPLITPTVYPLNVSIHEAHFQLQQLAIDIFMLDCLPSNVQLHMYLFPMCFSQLSNQLSGSGVVRSTIHVPTFRCWQGHQSCVEGVLFTLSMSKI